MEKFWDIVSKLYQRASEMKTANLSRGDRSQAPLVPSILLGIKQKTVNNGASDLSPRLAFAVFCFSATKMEDEISKKKQILEAGALTGNHRFQVDKLILVLISSFHFFSVFFLIPKILGTTTNRCSRIF